MLLPRSFLLPTSTESFKPGVDLTPELACGPGHVDEGSAAGLTLPATVATSVAPAAVSRRRWLALSAAPALYSAFPQQAWAGGQLEEPLADSVRGALSSAIANHAPPQPVFINAHAKEAYIRWQAAMGDRLRKRKPDELIRNEFLQTIWYEAKRAGLDVSLVMGLVQVESAFRKFAISIVGARGYMQVMPFWTRVIGDGDAGKLFHMQTNLRFGCVILRHYLDRERGDMFMALGRYNGSRGRDPYPNAVFSAQRNWLFDDKASA